MISSIGAGHFGEVFKGIYKQEDDDGSFEDIDVALKFSRRTRGDLSREFLKEREVFIKYGKRKGQHIVYYYGWAKLQTDIMQQLVRVCLVMEYIEGISLFYNIYCGWGPKLQPNSSQKKISMNQSKWKLLGRFNISFV